jgi:DNA-3-methyladenine glycosylase II
MLLVSLVTNGGTTLATIEITPRGPFSLAASARFLEDFTPARYQGNAPDGAVHLAFPADDGHSYLGAAVRQSADGTVTADLTGDTDSATAQAQLARIFSLDLDGSGFTRITDADPVLAGLAAKRPGLRPVCFGSPYEAAAWTVIGHRIRMTQAAAIKERIAEELGRQLTVAGAPLAAFPAPAALRDADHIPGLPEIKAGRLRAIADAALAGDLDAARLRAMPPADAMTQLRTLPGIGPFSAELTLIRGAGHPDLFPASERRLHAAMASAYQLSDPDPAQLAELSERWAPYRSWAALLLRSSADDLPLVPTAGAYCWSRSGRRAAAQRLTSSSMAVAAVSIASSGLRRRSSSR